MDQVVTVPAMRRSPAPSFRLDPWFTSVVYPFTTEPGDVRRVDEGLSEFQLVVAEPPPLPFQLAQADFRQTDASHGCCCRGRPVGR